MSIEFSCPYCFRRYKVKDELAGQRKNCKQCDREIEIPGGAAPREPRELTISESVRERLVQLRLLEQWAGEPVLNVDGVADVEDALKCTMPDEILAAFAAGVLDEEGFVLADVYDYQELAKAMRCPKDLLPVGRGPDGHILYCVGRQGARERKVGITTFCDEDGSAGYQSFPDWLDEVAERRRSFFLADEGSPLAQRIPTAAEVDDFRPRLSAE